MIPLMAICLQLATYCLLKQTERQKKEMDNEGSMGFWEGQTKLSVREKVESKRLQCSVKLNDRIFTFVCI